MSYQFYHILHLLSLFALTALTFYAFAAPVAERRKKLLMLSGITSFLVLLAGFGLIARTSVGFPLWIILKLFAWLVFSSLAGMAFRFKEKMPLLLTIASVAIVLAVLSVEYRFSF